MISVRTYHVHVHVCEACRGSTVYTHYSHQGENLTKGVTFVYCISLSKHTKISEIRTNRVSGFSLPLFISIVSDSMHCVPEREIEYGCYCM